MISIAVPINVDLMTFYTSIEQKQEIINSIMKFSSYEDFATMIVQAIKKSDEEELLKSVLLEHIKQMDGDNL